MGDEQEGTEDLTEATVDMVRRARGEMKPDEANGPEDASVTEVLKELPIETIYDIPEWFQHRAQSSWRIVKLVFLRKPDASAEKGIRDCQAIAPTSEMAKWYSSVVVQMLNDTEEPRGWRGKAPHMCRKEE